jgi:Tfp pilus assembly protein PilF
MSRPSESSSKSKTRPRLLVWLTGLGLLLAIGGFGAWYFWPALWLNSAETALLQNDPLAALEFLQRYRTRHPNDPQALLLSAQAARRNNDCRSAENFLTQYEKITGHKGASSLEWELLGAQQGDLIGVEEGLKSAVKNQSPDTPQIIEALAKGYEATYRWPEALKTLEFLLSQDKTHVPAMILHGSMLLRLHHADAAEQDFRRAVELMPNNSAARKALGELLQKRGYTDEALRNFQTAYKATPTDPAVLLGLARVYLDAAELSEAEHTLDKLLTTQPQHAEALVEKGRLLLRQGRAAEAEAALSRALATAPWNRDAQSLEIVALKELGRKEDADKAETRLAELIADDATGGKLKVQARDRPGDVEVRRKLWQWFERNGQPEEGLSWLSEILRVAPHDPQAHAALADYFDRVGQPKRAAEHRAQGPAAGSPGTGMHQ